MQRKSSTKALRWPRLSASAKLKRRTPNGAALPRLAGCIGRQYGKLDAKIANGERIGSMLAGAGLFWALTLWEGAPDKIPDAKRTIRQESRATLRISATRLQRAS